MKKVVVIAALALIGFGANAQDIKLGVKAGANFSNIKVDTDFGGGSPDGATSFYIGGLVDFSVSEKFHVQPEVLYSIEGAKDLDFSYVNIPLMGKFYLVEGFNIQAGPQLGILVDAEGGTDGLKSTNLSLNVGAAYEMEAGLFFDARYNFGLSNILEEEEGFNSELNTKGFQVGLGYRF